MGLFAVKISLFFFFHTQNKRSGFFNPSTADKTFFFPLQGFISKIWAQILQPSIGLLYFRQTKDLVNCSGISAF